jgi:hypothetical protein
MRIVNNNKLCWLLLLSFLHHSWSHHRRSNSRTAQSNDDDDDSNKWEVRDSYVRLLLGIPEDQRKQKIVESRFGTKRLLAVRVSSSEREYPSETLDAIEGAIFGTGPNPDQIPADATVVAQFRAVTHNQLIYEPVAAVVACPNMTRDGMLEIQVNVSMLDTSDSYERFDAVVQPAIVAQTETMLGRPLWDVADRVMFCLPTGSLRAGAAAIGDIGGMVRGLTIDWRASNLVQLDGCARKSLTFSFRTFILILQFTYYHLSSCTNLNVMMHELGHNLNFFHSNVGEAEYADKTGYMGATQLLDKSPLSVLKRWTSSLFGGNPNEGFGFPRKAYVRVLFCTASMVELSCYLPCSHFIHSCSSLLDRMDTNNGYLVGSRIEQSKWILRRMVAPSSDSSVSLTTATKLC